MAIQGTEEPDRTKPPRREAPGRSPFTARAAGLYSEVVWDRSWAAPAPGEAPDPIDADRRPSLLD